MLRASAIAIFLLTTPVYAQEAPDLDDLLVEMFNGDGEGDPADFADDPAVSNSGGARQQDIDLLTSCGGSFNPELDDTNPCSGWYVIGYTDEGEPAYFNCQMDIEAGRPCVPED